MEEERQREKVEIVESASIPPDDSLAVVFVPSGPCESIATAAEQSRISLLRLAPWEIASRRAVGQAIDFLIAYGGVFLYFYQSGFFLNRATGDLIHPLSVNLSLLGWLGFLFLFVLLPVPYLYLYWYFKVFRNHFTPGEIIVGIGSSCHVSEKSNWRWQLLISFSHFCQLLIALVWGLIAMTPLCLFVGLFLMLIAIVCGRRRGDELVLGFFLSISGATWIPLFALFGASDTYRGLLVFYVAFCAPVVMVLLVFILGNWPVSGSRLQSRSDLHYGISSVAIRSLGKPR